MSGSKSFFLSRGVTKASFISSGKTPDERERLIILVIGVASTETRLLRREVGNGSRAFEGSLNNADLLTEKAAEPFYQLKKRTVLRKARNGFLEKQRVDYFEE